MTTTTIKVTPAVDRRSIVQRPMLASEARTLIRRGRKSAARNLTNQNMLIDCRDRQNYVAIPAYKLGRDWFIDRDDLGAFERLVFINESAEPDAGASRELGLFIYTASVRTDAVRWVAVGNVWPLVTLSASEPTVCAVSNVPDGEGGILMHRAEVDVFDEARFREALKAVFA